MSNLNIISDVIIPIVASLIGGLLTLGGVIITINSQNKKDKEANKMRIKPYLYANNPYQIIKGLDNADSFVMLNENDSNIYLTITDVMNNEYYYKITCSFDGKKYYGINALEERISI